MRRTEGENKKEKIKKQDAALCSEKEKKRDNKIQ